MSLIQTNIHRLKATLVFLKKVSNTLRHEEQKKLIFSAAILAISNLLDLLGIFLIGLIGLIGVSASGLGNLDSNSLILRFLNETRISNLPIDKQISLIAAIAVLSFVIRTLFSMYFVKQIYFYLGKVASRITDDLMRAEFIKPVHSLNSSNSQQSLYRNFYGVDALTLGVLASIISVAADFALLILIGLSLSALNFGVTFLTFMYLLLVGFFLNKQVGPRSHVLGASRAQVSIAINRSYLYSLATYREITVRNRQKVLLSKIHELRKLQTQSLSEIAFLPMISKYVIEGAVIVGVMLLCFTQFLFLDAKTAVSNIAIFLAAGTRIAPAILRIQNSIITLRDSSGACSETLELLQLSNSEVQVEGGIPQREALPQQRFKPEIKVQSLYFSYNEEEAGPIRGLDLEVKVGDFVSIIGPSGSGKSTLVDLLLGLLPPLSGNISISGQSPLAAIRIWEGEIAYVPQDLNIFEGSIAENLTFSYPEGFFSKEQMWEALEFANLESFINSHPDGIDLFVGENGNRLSGGQRQRLCLARAIMTSPSLIVLDEATSALDMDSERIVNNALARLSGKATIISITHRVSTLKMANKIVLLGSGAVEIFDCVESLLVSHPKIFDESNIMDIK